MFVLTGGGNSLGELGSYILSRNQKINANFFWTKFFENPSGHGRLHQKSWTSAPKSETVRFPAAPMVGATF